MNTYRLKTIEQLFAAYQFENDRINKEDAKTTKRLISNELCRRLKSSLEMLDKATTEKEVEQIYEQFIGEAQHGQWISAPIKDEGYDSKTIPTCTCCGYQSFITYTYCPDCGAKLKE